MSNIDTELYSSCRKGNNDNYKSGCTKSQDDKLRFLLTRKRSTSRYVLWSNFKPHLFTFRFYVIIHLNIFILTFLCFHVKLLCILSSVNNITDVKTLHLCHFVGSFSVWRRSKCRPVHQTSLSYVPRYFAEPLYSETVRRLKD